MTNGSTISRYSGVAIAFHWVIALLVITNIVLARIGHDLPRLEKAVYMTPHKAIGITILVLSILRLLWRFRHKAPVLPEALKNWEAKLAKSVHYLFYFLIIAVPLTGWLRVAAFPGAPPVDYFGLFTIDLPIAESKGLSEVGHEGHEILTKLLFGLIIIHILAALKHQFADRIPFIQRMWP